MKAAWAVLVGVLTLGLVASDAQADRLLIERVDRAKTQTLPRKGSTMDQVEATFGAPTNKREAVGQPPITRWEYPTFIVYFEYRHVINAVLIKASDTEKGPRPVPARAPR